MRVTRFTLAILVLLPFALNPRPARAAESSSGWSAEWEKTVNAAEQEGEVVIYKIGEDAEWHALQKRFPKIKVTLVQGRASQLLQRIMAERRAGKFLADVIRLGGGTSTTLFKAGALDPIAPAFLLPEVKETSGWFEGKHHYNDSDNRYVFIYAAFPLRFLGYNKSQVDPRSIASLTDLLDPKWKGKMTIKDPRDPGGGSPLLFLYFNPRLGPDYIRKLIKVGGLTLLRDERQQIDWLANGKYPLAITAKAEDVEGARQQGLPVDMVDAHRFKNDGVGLEAGGTMISLANRAPHPNGARVVLNWFLSREGQTALQKGGPLGHGPNSLREDIAKDDIPPGLRRQPGTQYLRLWGPEVWDRSAIVQLIHDMVK